MFDIAQEESLRFDMGREELGEQAEMIKDRVYLAIDLKSFYASVECVERGLDPLNTNLVVADPSRTEKTICLAVSPALKSYGIPGRARLFEVVQRVGEVNQERRFHAPGRVFSGKSYLDSELRSDPSLELDYVIAPPQMSHYMNLSARIYGIYLRYVAPEDIFAYSIDEVFIDATQYLKLYGMDAHTFAGKLIRDVLSETGITATAGIGPNMFLCKVAMDIVAKHIPADEDGVRIASVDEDEFKRDLWKHRPLTDFWRVGRGIARKLEKFGVQTMGDIALMSADRDSIGILYQLFGKNAELLIDHAWGIEPTTMADVKAYKPRNNSLSSGQVLKQATDYAHTRLIVWEMADTLAMDLVAKGLTTDQVVLTIGYDRESLADGKYDGEVTIDYYGRAVPKHAHGTVNLDRHTSSSKEITEATMDLFDRIGDPNLLSRRITIGACNVIRKEDIPDQAAYRQMSLEDLLKDQEKMEQEEREEKKLQKEKLLAETMVGLKNKFGKNAVVKAKNLSEGGTAMERNGQIGGHKA